MRQARNTAPLLALAVLLWPLAASGQTLCDGLAQLDRLLAQGQAIGSAPAARADWLAAAQALRPGLPRRLAAAGLLPAARATILAAVPVPPALPSPETLERARTALLGAPCLALHPDTPVATDRGSSSALDRQPGWLRGTTSHLRAVSGVVRDLNWRLTWPAIVSLCSSAALFWVAGYREAQRRRYVCDLPCALRVGRRRLPARMSDLSALGCKLWVDDLGTVSAGQKVVLTLEGRRHAARLRWHTDEAAGLAFRRPLPLALVRQLLPRPGNGGQRRASRVPPGMSPAGTTSAAPPSEAPPT